MLSVSHGVADDVLEINHEGTTSLLVDDPGDALHASTTGKAANSWLRNTYTRWMRMGSVLENDRTNLGCCL
jgi:hypothetical protein